jgi:NodT family efflux transporter outer membrane factor (OMF) lipoprotein
MASSGELSMRSKPAATARVRVRLVAFLLLSGLVGGCTSLHEYIANGFKVGPNYAPPPAPVANEWIDAADKRVRSEADDLSQWWKLFNDPMLDDLIGYAYRQNLSLRAAGFRVLQARAQLAIDQANLLPQAQKMVGDFTRYGISEEIANSILNFQGTTRFFSQWDYGFILGWELDFWGRFRRAVEAGSASLDASVDNFDDVLVTLLGDVATYYTQIRTTELRIKYARDNVEIQRETFKLAEARFKAMAVDELDVDQARSTLAQTEAQIPELEIALRQANNRLCILLGIPPENLKSRLGPAPIPAAPPEVAVGIPADLLRRRPDVRRAERQAAAQSAEIGVAEAEFYPHIAIAGTIDYSAANFKDLFRATAFNGQVGPAFQWNILNYGRILNNVRVQDAHFEELVAVYQNTVLNASQDVENGLVTFLRAQERTKFQAESVEFAEKAVKIALTKYKAGTIDFTRVTQIQQTLVDQQDTLAQARGEIALGLIQTYRALGGGWQIRGTGCQRGLPAPETLPPPQLETAPQPEAVRK